MAIEASVKIIVSSMRLRATTCIVVVIVAARPRRRRVIVVGIAALCLGSTKGGPERPGQRNPEPPLSHPGGGGCGSGSWRRGVLLLVGVVVVGIVGGQLEAADRAGAVEVEPREDAIPVEDVFAGELLGGGAEVEVVHADGALGAAVGLHHVG
jgi:hypothetical protein